jgi:hypothetical protein
VNLAEASDSHALTVVDPAAVPAPEDGTLVVVSMYGDPSSGEAWYAFERMPPAAAAADHTILDGDVHTDTVNQTVGRGFLITAQDDPAKWNRLALNTQYKVVQSNGTDVVYDWVRAHA